MSDYREEKQQEIIEELQDEMFDFEEIIKYVSDQKYLDESETNVLKRDLNRVKTLLTRKISKLIRNQQIIIEEKIKFVGTNQSKQIEGRSDE